MLDHSIFSHVPGPTDESEIRIADDFRRIMQGLELALRQGKPTFPQPKPPFFEDYAEAE